MKTYVGSRRGGEVTVTVQTPRGERPLRHIAYHSPTGMEWGYPGGGPADLALSILVDALGESRRWQLKHGDTSSGLSRAGSRIPIDSRAWDLHQDFKREVVACFERAEFSLTENQVAAWVAQQNEAPDQALGF